MSFLACHVLVLKSLVNSFSASLMCLTPTIKNTLPHSACLLSVSMTKHNSFSAGINYVDLVVVILNVLMHCCSVALL